MAEDGFAALQATDEQLRALGILAQESADEDSNRSDNSPADMDASHEDVGNGVASRLGGLSDDDDSEREEGLEEKCGPRKCRNPAGCEFFGSETQHGLCSSCFSSLHAGEKISALLATVESVPPITRSATVVAGIGNSPRVQRTTAVSKQRTICNDTGGSKQFNLFGSIEDHARKRLGSESDKLAGALAALGEQDQLRYADVLRAWPAAGPAVRNSGGLAARNVVGLGGTTGILAMRNNMMLRPIRVRVPSHCSLATLFRAVAGRALAPPDDADARFTDLHGDRVALRPSPWTLTDAEIRRAFYADSPEVSKQKKCVPCPSPADRHALRFRRVAFRRNGTKRPDNAIASRDYSRAISALTLEKLKRAIYLEQQENASFAALDSFGSGSNILLGLRWWDERCQRSSSIGDIIVSNKMTIAEFKQHVSNVVGLSKDEIVIVEQETPEVFNVARDDSVTLEELELIPGDILVVEKLDPPFHMNSGGLEVHENRVCYACHAGPPIIGKIFKCDQCLPPVYLCARCNDLKRHPAHTLSLELEQIAPKAEHGPVLNKAIRSKTGEHYAFVRRKKVLGQAESARVALLREDAPRWSKYFHDRLPAAVRRQIFTLLLIVVRGRLSEVEFVGLHSIPDDVLFSIFGALVTVQLTPFFGLEETNRSARVLYRMNTSLNDHNDSQVADLVLENRLLSLGAMCRPALCVWQRGKAPARAPALGMAVDSGQKLCVFPDNGSNCVVVVSLRNGRTLLKVPALHTRRRGCGILPPSPCHIAPQLVVLCDHVMCIYDLSSDILAGATESTYTYIDSADSQQTAELFREDQLKNVEYEEEEFTTRRHREARDSSGNLPIESVNVTAIFHSPRCLLEELAEKALLAFYDETLNVDRVFIANCPRNRQDDCVMELRRSTADLEGSSNYGGNAHNGGWELYALIGRGTLASPTTLAVDTARRRLFVGQSNEAVRVFDLEDGSLLPLEVNVTEAAHIAVDPVSGCLLAAFPNASAVGAYHVLPPGTRSRSSVVDGDPTVGPEWTRYRALLTGDDALERPVGVAFCTPGEGCTGRDDRLYVLDAEFEGLRVIAL